MELIGMTAAEYGSYIARCLADYVAEGARATSMTSEAAQEFGRAQFRKLLPDGQHTAGHHFRNLVVESGEAIGHVWFTEQPPSLFIYEVVIDEAQRGRGYGSAAMHAIEDEARRLGAETVELHVFTHNTGAIRLYQRLGYETTDSGPGGMRMSKTL